ncbi:Arc family DNA-binding protein [Sinorhizobium medicae]|uniref:Arc family DNA-binding protein n=1 Tax=Sinorhizobium medicae TaxID=110321 RepID=UPI0023549D08|nr:Arc family DNA-binding protein [Sinorhizobium medicae]
MLRLPAGMRDRIAEVARANNRSMNSEIVSALTRAFPPTEPDDAEINPEDWREQEIASILTSMEELFLRLKALRGSKD